ncbi:MULTISPECIES: hypothetical protein [Pseudomonas]|uniref:hypothetical protein n=1 Tax=Pseudomonas TaxID=286 RepID=UPI00132E8163|nr:MULTISPECIES: hypothetical protein [Pseudomonas]MCP6695917.1 hypothetical protein [Pseudomonas donghuensis]QHF28528.1 hypothetical protein PspR32_12215 [Pseudomonas sp. R32]
MTKADESQIEAHKLLILLDAETSLAMRLVAMNTMSGPEWQAMCKRHRACFEAWARFTKELGGVEPDVVTE